MNITKKTNILSFILPFLIIGSIASSSLGISKVLAANTSMELNPGSGSYIIGSPITVNLIIDGHGDIFNAAKATVTLSPNLNATDLTLGDCNFSLVTTPTIANPSFTGVLLGTSSDKCTVYTLTLMPISAGTGTITLSNAEVKQFKTANDILTSLQNGSYSLIPASNEATSSPPSPTNTITQPTPAPQTSASNPYSLTIKAVNIDNTPLAGVTVILESSQVSQPVQAINTPTVILEPSQMPQPVQEENNSALGLQTAITDKNGIAQFSNVPQGIHTVVVKREDKQLAKTVLNVDGPNRAMTLGIKSQNQPLKLNFKIIFLVTLLVIGIIIFLFLRNPQYIKILTGGKNTDKEVPRTPISP